MLVKEALSLKGTSCLEASRALVEERKGVGHGVERYKMSNLDSTLCSDLCFAQLPQCERGGRSKFPGQNEMISRQIHEAQ